MFAFALTIIGSNGISLTVNLSFAVTETQSVTSIAVKTQPAKLNYTAGEILDLAGLVVTLTYSDRSTADIAYAQFATNGITANPDRGTVLETAIHNGQAIILTCNTQTAIAGNLTVNAAPTYAIMLSETGTHTFSAQMVGYTPVAPITVIVTRIGTGNITNLAASLSGSDADDFTLGESEAATLDSITPATTFTMKPNGKTETAATATTIQEGDKTVTTVVVDDKKVKERLEQEGNNAVVTIPVNNGADLVVGTLNGQTVRSMENKEAVLEIKTGQVTYTLPASQINIDAVSEQIGKQVELKDITVSVEISAPAADTVKIVEDAANKNNYQIVVKPIEFKIACSNGNKTVEVDKFNVYVERMIAIPEGVDPSKITTGIILNSDGTFSHVPTVITMIDGKYYAKINSLTNSAYFVIYNKVEFKDAASHWAKEAVDDMGSRLIVSGVGNGRFEPVRDITRGEFAAILAKALGLMRPGTGKASFNDISKNDWCYDAVSIAYEYGIVSGYGDGKFGPGDKITREQAMTMIAKAMQITKLMIELTDSEVSKVLAGFTDANSAAAYAKTGIAACVKAGIVSGRSKNDLAPKDNITRAEAAVIVRKLLQKSGLI